jgi:hypothetical protein
VLFIIAHPRNVLRYWTLFAAHLITLIYWFMTAPEARFVLTPLFAIPATLLALALWQWKRRVIMYVIIMTAFVLSTVELYVTPFNQDAIPRSPSLGAETVDVVSGISMYSPIADIRCFDLPLPCRPRDPILAGQVELRTYGYLGDGFRNCIAIEEGRWYFSVDRFDSSQRICHHFYSSRIELVSFIG